ncbi:hypothetical protein D3C77_417550 [compost metagenome]
MMSPWYSSGVTTSTFITGSSNTAPPFSFSCLVAIEAATLKAISLESTSWYEPSNTVAFKPISGYPATTPFCICSSMPFWIAGMYSRGTTPPTTSLTNSRPSLPSSPGAKRIQQCPYWPRPPD